MTIGFKPTINPGRHRRSKALVSQRIDLVAGDRREQHLQEQRTIAMGVALGRCFNVDVSDGEALLRGELHESFIQKAEALDWHIAPNMRGMLFIELMIQLMQYGDKGEWFWWWAERRIYMANEMKEGRIAYHLTPHNVPGVSLKKFCFDPQFVKWEQVSGPISSPPLFKYSLREKPVPIFQEQSVAHTPADHLTQPEIKHHEVRINLRTVAGLSPEPEEGEVFTHQQTSKNSWTTVFRYLFRKK